MKKNNPNLTDEQKLILFDEGTEPPGSSELNSEKRKGSYHCANCSVKLFESNAKYEISTLFGVERRIEMDNLDQQFSKLFPLELISENIRILINEETYDLQMQSRSGIDMFFGDNDPPLIGPVLDATKEQDRLNQLLNK